METTIQAETTTERVEGLTRLDLIAIILSGLAVATVCSIFQNSPGYMDAAYYYSTGGEIARGNGLWEPYIWNYLDDPTGLPHPAFVYWMPLASLIAAGGMRLLGGVTFENAQAPFVLLASLVPILTAMIAIRITANRSVARLAGFIAVFPGIYLPLMTTTETFVPVMILGGAWFLVTWEVGRADRMGKLLWLSAMLGLIAGMLHLARADGLIWLGLSGLVVMSASWRASGRSVMRSITPAVLTGLVVLAGYLLLMGAWYYRNIQLFGALFSPAGGRSLFITTYNELYSYPSHLLTFAHWASQPLAEHLTGNTSAIAVNLGNLLGTQTGIFMLPLIVMSAWQRRRETKLRWFFLAMLLIWFVMTVVFPYAGKRGGYLHSGAALQPALWALAADGLWRTLQWASKRRGWNFQQAWKVFAVAAVVVQVGLSGYALAQIIGPEYPESAWDEDERNYRQVDQALIDLGAQPGDLVLSNNPPAYYSATGRGGISIPNGSIDRAVAAGQRFGVRFLVLEEDQGNLSDLYATPTDLEGLDFLATSGDFHLFELEGE